MVEGLCSEFADQYAKARREGCSSGMFHTEFLTLDAVTKMVTNVEEAKSRGPKCFGRWRALIRTLRWFMILVSSEDEVSVKNDKVARIGRTSNWFPKLAKLLTDAQDAGCRMKFELSWEQCSFPPLLWYVISTSASHKQSIYSQILQVYYSIW